MADGQPASNGAPRTTKADALIEEHAGVDLKLGEFQHADSLSLSEARTVIEAIVQTRKAQKKRLMESETYQKMMDYLDEFSRIKNREAVESVQTKLETRQDLHSFERSQISSLCPETAEEAKTLVPSLTNKIEDEDLQELLDELNTMVEAADELGARIDAAFPLNYKGKALGEVESTGKTKNGETENDGEGWVWINYKD